MALLLAISFIFTLFALVFLSRTLRSARHGKLLRAGTSCASCVLSGGIAAAAILITLSYYSYERLTAEQDIARIEFIATGPDAYRVRLLMPGRTDQLFDLRGDEWQIDAKMISWKPPITVLGLDPIFRLERLSGRYASVDRELSEIRTVHDLSPPEPLDLWQMARRFPIFLPGVDAYYGTATYLPMANGARFTITISRDALLARPDNDEARQAVGGWGKERT